MNQTFLEWSSHDVGEINEEDIQDYFDYLTNTHKLGIPTVKSRKAAISLLLFTITDDIKYYLEPRRKLIMNGCLEETREIFIQYLEDMGYDKKNLKNFRWIIKCVDHYMQHARKGSHTI